MLESFKRRLNRTRLWYGLIAGGFWGWLSGGGVGAVFGVIACYFEPLLSGMYGIMALAGIGMGMLLGTIGGAASGAIGGATANPRVGLVTGILFGALFGLISAMNLLSPSLFAITLYSVTAGAPAAFGGYCSGPPSFQRNFVQCAEISAH
jgi:hypothetical protein